MSKINSALVFRIGATVLLSLMSVIGKGIAVDQAAMTARLHVVQLNQVKIMAVLGIEPYATTLKSPEIGRIMAVKPAP